MSSLFNALPVPTGLRHCWWDSEYIASQPFCITSKLTDQEAKVMADYEEIRAFEYWESIKSDLAVDLRVSEADDGTDDDNVYQPEKLFIDAKKAVDLYLVSPKKFYFVVQKATHRNVRKRLGFCYTPTSDGVPSSNKATALINRAYFLNR